MIISRTPFRVSFFGGGTDYPGWICQNGGAVLSTSIDKYCYITCRNLPAFFDHKYRVAYSKIEHTKTIEEIQHPAIRSLFKAYEEGHGFELHCDADLPARSGLGSSSSFIVGLLNSLEGMKGNRVSHEWLAKEAIRYEQDVLAENVGCQDQVAAAFGGLNTITFHKDCNFSVDPVIISKVRRDELQDHLLLFFTGFSRIASNIAEAQIKKMDSNADSLHAMRCMVDDAVDILSSDQDIRQFGEMLHTSWMYKRNLSDKVAPEQVDTIYERARAAGAIGGKLLGAGGGGFILFFVEKDKQDAVVAELSDLVHVPFEFENGGSRIIYFDGECG
ncbi:kinase [Desulfovibrio sp. JC022]|uniref:GHMP family kinase ATP-binding protein n=1 Tax=Desulfovibrio sp. JC022 TaxID=2593642 RepID=UPI0013D319C9|nr:kinase [Desulfovibrio sp. JC022]NDV24957.1 kinase [Desulfovibrio sp. JC022]